MSTFSIFSISVLEVTSLTQEVGILSSLLDGVVKTEGVCEDVGTVEKDSNRIWRNGRKKGLGCLTQICIPEASGAERDGVCFPLFPVGLRKSTDFLFSLCSAPL